MQLSIYITEILRRLLEVGLNLKYCEGLIALTYEHALTSMIQSQTLQHHRHSILWFNSELKIWCMTVIG